MNTQQDLKIQQAVIALQQAVEEAAGCNCLSITIGLSDAENELVADDHGWINGVRVSICDGVEHGEKLLRPDDHFRSVVQDDVTSPDQRPGWWADMERDCINYLVQNALAELLPELYKPGTTLGMDLACNKEKSKTRVTRYDNCSENFHILYPNRLRPAVVDLFNPYPKSNDSAAPDKNCAECHGTGHYVSPLTAKRSPCSVCSARG